MIMIQKKQFMHNGVVVDAVLFDGSLESAVAIAGDQETGEEGIASGHDVRVINYGRPVTKISEKRADEGSSVKRDQEAALLIVTPFGTLEPRARSYVFIADGRVTYLWEEEMAAQENHA